MIIGRYDPATGLFPQIDLTALDADRVISRQHARLHRSDGQWCIVDLGSSNGTFVNVLNVPLKPMADTPLHDGDLVVAGKIRLRFQVCQRPGEASTAPRVALRGGAVTVEGRPQ